MNNTNQVRVRFAPSPTGHLHIGGLRTALFNWLFARHNGGVFLLRIEDTDLERSTQEYRDSILQSLEWTGLTYDETLVTQSDRIAEHRAVAQKLIDAGKAYHCFCSYDDIAKRYSERGFADNHNPDINRPYDGHCRNRLPQDNDSYENSVVRFKLPEDRTEVTFNDLIKEPITFSLDQLDDFIILRSGNYPMYNFVVVVDDAHMRITHIIRGEEHIVNTPKQILLYQACGYDVPFFAHLPLILGPSGEKLSKRDGATSVVEYRKEGYLAPALLNYLARLGWSHGDKEIFSLSELIQFFSLEHVGHKGSIFDFEKLAWVNSMYIRDMTSDELYESIIHDVNHCLFGHCGVLINEKRDSFIDLYKDRVKTVKELAQEMTLIGKGSFVYEQSEKDRLVSLHAVQVLDAFIALCEQYEEEKDFYHGDAFNAFVVTIKELTVSLGIKLVFLYQLIRLALIGKASGPGVLELLVLIGKEESIARLRTLRDILYHKS